MRYKVDEVTRWGLEPYAVYGGYVYSFKCKQTGDRIHDASLLDKIFAMACDRANELIEEQNKNLRPLLTDERRTP